MTARPLVQRVEIDISRAQSQINELERQIASLSQPVNIPVEIESDQSLDQLRRDVAAADNQTVDIAVDVDGVDAADASFDSLNAELEQTESGLRQVGDQADLTGRDLDQAGDRGDSAFRRMGGSIVALGGALVAFQGFRLLITGAGAAIEAASNFQESVSKADVVFGEFSDDIKTFASTGPQALGLTTAAALEATATFGNLFVALGLTQESAATLAPDIVQLASDLASFNNIEVAEAVEKLRAGLVGEAEPLRTLGVNINEAATQAKALELGLVGANGEISEAAKVQSRYALIVEQTATAQGDFARTADGVANSQRTLTALLGDAAAEIGDALLPAFGQLLDIAPALIDGLSDFAPVIGAIATSAVEAAPSVSSLADGLQALGEVPAAIGNLLDLTTGIGGLFQGALQFLTDAEAGAQTFNSSLEQIGGVIDSIAIGQLKTSLVDALQAGVDPAVALTNTLIALQNEGLDTAQFQAAAEAFTQIAGVDISRMSDITAQLRAAGEAAGLTTAEIDQLVRGIFGAVAAGTAARNRGAGGRRDAADQKREADAAAEAARRAAEATLTEVEALDLLGAAADESGVSIGALLTDVEALPPELQAAAGAVDESTAAFLRQMEAIDHLQQPIGALPGTMEEAAAALSDAEGKIVEDFDIFVEQMRERLEARQAFETNLAILRALGLDDLANIFDEAGLPSATALADAIASPEKLEEAKSLLEGDFGSTATDLMGVIGTAVEGDDQTKIALIDNLIQAANAADDPAVRAALTALAEEAGAGNPRQVRADTERARSCTPVEPAAGRRHTGDSPPVDQRNGRQSDV